MHTVFWLENFLKNCPLEDQWLGKNCENGMQMELVQMILVTARCQGVCS
jgi:hypothetical protein